MLFSANVEPTCALPIGDRAMTKNEATAASTAEKRRARTRSQLVLTPPRFADRSSKPDRPQRESRPGRVEPEIGQPRPDDDDDECHGDRSDARGEHRSEVGADDPLGRRSQRQRDPVQDAERGEGGDDRGDLESSDQAGVDETESDAAEQDDPDPDHDLGDGGLGADQEGGDDHPEADHAADGQIEVPDEERMVLRHGRDDQGAAPG